MSAATFKGAMCTGHDCYPPRPNLEGDDDVTVNGIPIHLVGHKWPIHVCGNSSHDGVLVSGSTTVAVGDFGIGRIGDMVSCGSLVAEGSPDVLIGD